MIMNNQNPLGDSSLIYSYTRKQAIEDGVLVGLSDLAKKIGFLIPVACTAAVWNQYVETRANSRALGECEPTRSYSLLCNLYLNISRQTGTVDLLMFDINYHNDQGHKETFKLKSICGPGDQGESVLTVMLPNED